MFQIRFANGRSIKIEDDLLQRAISDICESNLNALIVDLESESDFVFANVPALGVRKYAGAWEFYHPNTPQEFDEIGDADAAYPQILAMFNCVDASPSMPVPSVVDDWKTYLDWMRALLA